MRILCISFLAVLIAAVSIPAVEKKPNLNGTWVLDPSHSDSGMGGQARRTNRTGSILGGIIPGLGYPGGGYPGGTGYPGGRRTGGYPRGGGGDDGDGTEVGMPRGQMRDLTLQIVQTDNELQATRRFTVDGEEQTIDQKFLLDGSESTNTASNGRGQFVSRSTWKDDKLVNTGTQSSSVRGQNYDTAVKEEYSLSKDGKVLTIKTTRTTSRGERTYKQVFNKQETSQSSPPQQ